MDQRIREHGRRDRERGLPVLPRRAGGPWRRRDRLRQRFRNHGDWELSGRIVARPAGVATGSLRVTISGLATTLVSPPPVRVTGPGGFNRLLAKSTTLADVLPGTYHLRARPFATGEGKPTCRSHTPDVELRASDRRRGSDRQRRHPVLVGAMWRPRPTRARRCFWQAGLRAASGAARPRSFAPGRAWGVQFTAVRSCHGHRARAARPGHPRGGEPAGHRRPPRDRPDVAAPRSRRAG